MLHLLWISRDLRAAYLVFSCFLLTQALVADAVEVTSSLTDPLPGQTVSLSDLANPSARIESPGSGEGGSVTGAGASGVISFTMGTFIFSEEQGVVFVEALRTEGAQGAVEVGCNVIGGTAEADADYIVLTERLIWEDGIDGIMNCEILFLDDLVFEGDETIELELTIELGGAILGDFPTAVVTIRDLIDIFGDGFESGDVSAWSSSSPFAETLLEGLKLRTVGDFALFCPSTQLAPPPTHGGIRLRFPMGSSTRMVVSDSRQVLVDRQISGFDDSRTIEITGVPFGDYDLLIERDRHISTHRIEIDLAHPCRVLGLEP